MGRIPKTEAEKGGGSRGKKAHRYKILTTQCQIIPLRKRREKTWHSNVGEPRTSVTELKEVSGRLQAENEKRLSEMLTINKKSFFL